MKILTTILAAALLACIVVLAWVLATPPPEDPRLTRLEADLKEARQTITQLRRDLANRPVSSAPTAGRASGTVPMDSSGAGTAAAGAASAPGATASTGGTTGDAIRDMMKNPAMRELMLQQQATQIESSYARLFEYLQLSDEEKAHFKKLLVERARIENEYGLKLLDPNVTPEERQKIIAEAEKGISAFNQTIKGFLNNESDWGTFQSWEGTKAERTSFETMGRSIFNASGEPLSTQQEDQLIELMAKTRQESTSQQAELSKMLQNPGQMNEANIQKVLEFQRATNERIYQQAGAILSPNQMKSLGTFQNQIFSNYESGLKLGGEMNSRK